MRAAPERVRKGAAKRLVDSMPEQAFVEDRVRAGRPLDAEEDPARKLAFIEHALDVPRPVARRIAAYEDPKNLPITPAQQAGAESLQGRTTDFVPAYFLDLARAASRSVARVALDGRQAIGTGFLVAPGVFLTNHHVIATEADARSMRIELSYEVDADLHALPVSRFRLDPERLFVFDETDDLDFTLVAVGDRVDGPEPLERFGYLPLLETPDRHVLAMFVNVVQHPEGRPKELVLRENRLLARTDSTVIYGADTLAGSSGSPVFNDEWEVLALHHWGAPSRAKLDPRELEAALPTSGNEGIRVSAIAAELRRRMKRLAPAQRALVEQVISPKFRRPSLAVLGRPEERATMPNREALETKPVEEGTAATTATTTIQVPIVVSVRIGAPSPSLAVTATAAPTEAQRRPDAPRADEEVAPGAERLSPDPKYENRRGYKPSFLGIDVRLPVLKDEALGAPAPNLRTRRGEDPFVLPYEHFSVVMNGDRRLAYFTAVNIDGAAVVKVDRKTGKVTHVEAREDDTGGAEAYERWYDDERIAPEHRTTQRLYDDGALARFQRGHLVKRTDPSWGTAQRGVRGQADTFHFTNCAPQHERFNPSAERWAGVENWITGVSDAEDLRVSVFTGPVFGADDPELGGVQVPLRFWKLVAWVEDGSLRASALLADQGGVVQGREALGEPPPDLAGVEPIAIAELEALTHLDLGVLRAADTYEPRRGEERVGARREPPERQPERVRAEEGATVHAWHEPSA